MQALDLVSYIRHGMILKNLAEHDLYDAIIYESFTDTKIEVPEKLTIHALDTKNLHDIHAKLHAHIDHYERVLIILDTLDITDILPVLQTYLPQQSSLDKTLEE